MIRRPTPQLALSPGQNLSAPLYLSLSCCGNVPVAEALATCHAAGINHVELAIGPSQKADCSSAVQQFSQLGMQFRAHHAFVWEHQRPFNLAAAFDMEYFERLCDWLAEHQISAYSVHAGSYPRLGDKERAYDNLLQHLDLLQHLCAQRHIELAVETMDRLPLNCPMQNLLDGLEAVGQCLRDLPALKLVVDLAHLNLWPDLAATQKLSLLQQPERLLEIHLSDNDGRRDSHAAITAQTWWVPFVSALPAVPLVLESRMSACTVEALQGEYGSVLNRLTGAI